MLYFDASRGVSGDMFAGAMIDLGADFTKLRADILALNLPDVDISIKKTTRGGVLCTKFDVATGSKDQPHRHLADVVKIINNTPINADVKQSAISIFKLLAEAEAKAHNTDIESVHFHEVGAIDSIVDIVAAANTFHQFCTLADMKGFAHCSPINTGSGTVKCAHGIIPVPAPAVKNLLEGMESFTDGTDTELATPTGVAILKYFSSGHKKTPQTAIISEGVGGGTKELVKPNIFKVIQVSE